MTITFPTTITTAEAIAAANPDADVVHEQGRMSVYLGAVVFVAEIPEVTWTAFPFGYLSRRAAS